MTKYLKAFAESIGQTIESYLPDEIIKAKPVTPDPEMEFMASRIHSALDASVAQSSTEKRNCNGSMFLAFEKEWLKDEKARQSVIYRSQHESHPCTQWKAPGVYLVNSHLDRLYRHPLQCILQGGELTDDDLEAEESCQLRDETYPYHWKCVKKTYANESNESPNISNKMNGRFVPTDWILYVNPESDFLRIIQSACKEDGVFDYNHHTDGSNDLFQVVEVPYPIVTFFCGSDSHFVANTNPVAVKPWIVFPAWVWTLYKARIRGLLSSPVVNREKVGTTDWSTMSSNAANLRDAVNDLCLTAVDDPPRGADATAMKDALYQISEAKNSIEMITNK